MDAVYPSSASALARGRRLRRGPQRARTRTQPVTFAEIKEVDEEAEQSEQCVGAAGSSVSIEERRRRDELSVSICSVGSERGSARAADALALELVAHLADCRRRRARPTVIPEPPDEGAGTSSARAASEPRPQSPP